MSTAIAQVDNATDDLISDAEDPLYVYDWRLQPERAMRESKGRGMSDEQVINFVNGCELHEFYA